MRVRITDGSLRDEGLEFGAVVEAQPMRQSCRSKTSKPDVVVHNDTVGGVIVRSHQYVNADAGHAGTCAHHLLDELQRQPWFRSVGVVAENLVVYHNPGTAGDETLASLKELLERFGYQGCCVKFREAPSLVLYPKNA